MDQLPLFDLEQTARDAVAATAWHGAPLAFTTAYYAPADLDAARERWNAEHGHYASDVRSHMWGRAMWAKPTETPGHRLDLFTADLRCDSHRGESCQDLGDLLYLAVCEPCAWNAITASENAAAEAWHDHALPGWRDLPPLPRGLAVDDARTTTWLEKHYPAEWLVDGAPVRTHRGEQATRHVPGRSPLGGYDLAVVDERED